VTPVVVGFDLSLTAPAAVALPLDWRPGDWKRAKSWLIRPEAPKSDDRQGQLVRYGGITLWARGVIREAAGTRDAPGRALAECAIEAYAFSKNTASASKLMELGGVVRVSLYEMLGVVPVTVNTSSARKLLLGKVPKSDQKIAVQRFLFDAGAPKDWEENICDAACIANFALSNAGGVALTGSV
jgi:hypothetical protein